MKYVTNLIKTSEAVSFTVTHTHAHTRRDFCRHLPSVNVRLSCCDYQRQHFTCVCFHRFVEFPQVICFTSAQLQWWQCRTLDVCTLEWFNQLQSKCIALFCFIIQQVRFCAPTVVF